jgi:transcriptional regulator with XRE-family HTH domain
VSAIQPGRLREAREYIGFSREDVAGAVHTDPLALADMEDGTAEPTEAMLAKLSKFYRRPLTWFSGEWEYQPPPDLLRKTENLYPGDREAVLDFAEFLAGAGEPPKITRADLDREVDRG